MKPQTEITDFRKILDLVVADGKSIMIGGHAVNFWALFYFHRIEAELRQFMPFTSKDLDFYGDSNLLESLRKSFGGMKSMSEPRGPVIGRVELKIDGVKRIVEVIHSVHACGLCLPGRDSSLGVWFLVDSWPNTCYTL